MKPIILTFDTLNTLLPPRKPEANKGDFGHVLVIGGNQGMAGAVALAAMAAGRTGSGLVTVATLQAHVAAVVACAPEVMCHGVDERDVLDELIARATVIAVGPGLGKDKWADNMMTDALKQDKPLVVDADGLKWLAANPCKRDNWVLTPHPGEAAMLLGCTVDDIQQDRVKSAEKIVKKYSGVCVLKGKGTLVCGGDETALSICEAGNPGMASGGMGDILTGVIAGLLAQGLSLRDGANVGVLVHSVAGDRAIKEDGQRGLLATDLLPIIRALVNP